MKESCRLVQGKGFKESSYLALMRIQWDVTQCIDVNISHPGVMTELGGCERQASLKRFRPLSRE